MQQTKANIYFPGLNGLRFFAALAVIITHIELLKSQTNVVNCWSNIFIFNLGGLGVYFFFVLSGFLITYLLLAEKMSTQTISIKKFYIRRILRIWPLYYLIIFLGFFVFPHIHFLRIEWLAKHTEGHLGGSFLLNALMLPNLAFAVYGPVAHIGQAWSIGVEEQFYLIWPVLVKFSKNVLRTVILVGVLIVTFKVAVLLMCHFNPGSTFLGYLKPFVAMSKIECMAIGASGAYVLFYKWETLLRIAYHPISQAAAYLSIPALIYFTPDCIQDGIHLVFSFSFLIIILNVSTNKSSFLKLDNKLFDFLGRISYGLYMYHLVLVVFVIRSFPFLSNAGTNSLTANLYYYLGSVLLTVLIAWLSHEYVEKWFLKKKVLFSEVLSKS
jgi:peptidoglycan/LPS O-acetylase OafA/YrhL